MKNTDTDKTYVTIGTFGSTYGVKGWIKIQGHTHSDSNIFDYSPWLIEENNQLVALDIEDGRPHGKLYVAKIAHYDTPEAVKKFTGKNIHISRSQLPTLPENEYYWSDLIDLTVINQRGETLGKVVELLETGANDVLIVAKDKTKTAIPYRLNSVITSIDLKKAEIHVDWEVI